MMNVAAAVLLLVVVEAEESSRSVRVWQSPSTQWPEDGMLDEERHVGVAISGGGYRSYDAALGEFRALHDLGVLKSVRYMAAVSGGAWATAAYVYAQSGVSEERLLGEIWEPENITVEALEVNDEKSARAAPARALRRYLAEALVKLPLPHQQLDRVWEQGISKAILEPLNVKRDALLTWDEASRDDIVRRNPSMAENDFIWPMKPRPFPIFTTTFLGPFDSLPQPDEKIYVQSEVTPLYAGVPHTRNMIFTNNRTGDHVELQLGGLVETIGYGSGPPASGLRADVSEGLVSVTAPEHEFTVARAVAQSSMNPAAQISQVSSRLAKASCPHVNYWSPAASQPVSTEMDVGDGGSLESLGIMPLLRRGLKRIIVLDNSLQPLASREQWDPQARDPTSDDVAGHLSALFGFDVYGIKGNLDYSKNQVFAKKEMAQLGVALQDAKAKGFGTVATLKLTTMSNLWWNIPGGLETTVTFVYLDRVAEWEARLSPDMSERLFGDSPDKHFVDFPYYATTQLYHQQSRANLLSSLMGTSILWNAEHFQDIVNGSLARLASAPTFV